MVVKVGNKLWSSNFDSIPAVRKLLDEEVVDFLELYYVPGTIDKLDFDGLSNIPIIIHAPHASHGLNLALEPDEMIVSELKELVSRLNYIYIIFHPGTTPGNIENTIKNLKKLGFRNALIENMPLKLPYKDVESVASTPDEFRQIMDEAGVGFCLDFSHAICSAVSHGKDRVEWIKQFKSLSPNLYHFSDGDYTTWKDVHKHLGEGDFPLKELAAHVKGYVTLETPKKDFVDLSEDRRNIKQLRILLEGF